MPTPSATPGALIPDVAVPDGAPLASGPPSYTVSGPSPAATIGSWATFTVTPSTTIASDTFTPSDGGAGGAFYPATLTWAGSSAAQTLYYLPVAASTTLSGSSAHGYTVNGDTFPASAAATPGLELATLTGGIPASYVDATGELVYFLAQYVAVGSGASATATVAGGALAGFTGLVGGSGYKSPAVTITPTGGDAPTTVATAVAVVLDGIIRGVVITNPGAGYVHTPTIAFASGSGTTATATATVSGSSVTAITVSTAGTGYAWCAFSGGGGTGAAATPIVSGGAVTGLAITSTGRGYTSAPSLTISGITPAYITAVNTGSSPISPVIYRNGVPVAPPMGVTSIVVDTQGTGYTSGTVSVTIAPAAGDATGGGATATATIGTGGNAGKVTAIAVARSGAGYTLPPTVTVNDSGTGSGATAHAVLGPFWSSAASWEPWVCYQLPSPAAPTDVFTFAAPSGWLAAGSSSIGYTANGAIHNYSALGSSWHGAKEPTPVGWGMSGFGVNTGTTPVGVGMNWPDAWYDGPFFAARNWARRGHSLWPNATTGGNPAVVTDGNFHPTSIVTSLGAYGVVLRGPLAGPGIWRFTADESDSTNPMAVNPVATGSIVQTITTPSPSATTGKYWEWAVYPPSPLPTGGLPSQFGVQVVGAAVHNPGPWPWTLSNEWITPPQSYAAAPIGYVAITGYGAGNYTNPQVAASGGGTGATFSVTKVNGAVVSIAVTNGGSGYTSAPTVSISGTGGSGATAFATVAYDSTGVGAVTAITVTNCGSGYASAAVSLSGGGGTGAAATATLADNVISAIAVTAGGTGYTAPVVTITDPGGSGAGATAIAFLAAPAQPAVADVSAPDMNVVASLTTPSGKSPAWLRFIDLNYDGESNVVDASDLHTTSQFDWQDPPSRACALAYSSGGLLQPVLVGGGQFYFPTTAPTATITKDPSDTGSGANFIATTSYGTSPISNVSMQLVTGLSNSGLGSPGSNYLDQPTVSFSGGGGTGASAVGVVVGGAVTGFILLSGGSGYTSVPTATITGGGGTGATVTATLGAGVVSSSFTITNGGTGYVTAPTVTITRAAGDITGSGATATATITGTAVTGITLTNAGSRYTQAPTVSFTPTNGGSGAAATASITGSLVGQVTGFTALVGGSGYHNSATVAFSGGQPTAVGAQVPILQVRPYAPSAGSPGKVYVSDNHPGTSASPGYPATEPLPYYWTTTDTKYVTGGTRGSANGTIVMEFVTPYPHGFKTGQAVIWYVPTANPSGPLLVSGANTQALYNFNGTFPLWVTGLNTFVVSGFPGTNWPSVYPWATLTQTTATPGVFAMVTVPDNATIPPEIAAAATNYGVPGVNVALSTISTLDCTRAIANRMLPVLSPTARVSLALGNEHWDALWNRNIALWSFGVLGGLGASYGNQALNDAIHAQRASAHQYAFWQVFDAAGRGGQVIRTFGSWWNGIANTQNMIAFANANTVPGTAVPIQVDVVEVAPYPSMIADPPMVAAAALMATSDARGILHGAAYPWTRAMYSSFLKHHIKYNTHDRGQWAGHAAACAAYTGPATAFGSVPAVGVYEDAIDVPIPAGTAGSGATNATGDYLRSQLINDLKYDPSYHMAVTAEFESAQDGGAAYVIESAYCAPSGNGASWDAAVHLYPIFAYAGQPWGYGDGSDGKAVNRFQLPSRVLPDLTVDFLNVSVKAQAWRDWADVANGAAPTPTPTPTPGHSWFPGLRRPRRWMPTIAGDIRSRMDATGAFDEVWLSGPPEGYGRGASLARAASVEPGTAKYAKGWDAQLDGGLDFTASVSVTVMARDPDPESRDAAAEQMVSHLANAVNGQSLGELTLPARTLVTGWRWKPATPPERRIEATVSYAEITEGWDDFDADP